MEPFNYGGDEVADKSCIWYMFSLPAQQHAQGTHGTLFSATCDLVLLLILTTDF